MNITELDPSNDVAMNELFDYVAKWTKRHNFSSTVEHAYLAQLLAGRLNVAVSMEKLLKLKSDYDDEAIE